MKNCFNLPKPLQHSDAEKMNHEEALQKWDLFADVLYWKAGIPGCPWSFKLPGFFATFQPGVSIESQVNPVLFEWNVGCRIGTKYHTSYDAWEMQFTYTWFKTKSHERGSISPIEQGNFPSAFAGVTITSDLGVPGLLLVLSQKGSIQWNLLYNMFDFEIVRKFPLSKDLFFRPYLGAKGGWIHQHIHAYEGYIFNITSKEILRNHFWGIGPKGGVHSQWNLGRIGKHSFYLSGDFAGAFLWGQWFLQDTFRATDNASVFFKIARNTGGALMLQDLMGLGWIFECCRDRFLLALQGSYEMQFWFDQLRLFSDFNGRYHNPLTLQGAVFEQVLIKWR